MLQALEKRTVTVYGKTVAYWTNNQPTRHPVIFVHGFRGNHKGLQGIAREMQTSNVIVPDLPGYGESEAWDTKEHTIQAYCEFLNDFRTALGLTTYSIVGHSFGATLTILFAEQFPEHIKKIVLVAPVIASQSIESAIGSVFYRTARHIPHPLRRYYLVNQPIDAAANVMLLKSASLHRKLEIIVDGLRNVPNLSEHIIMENFISMYKSTPMQSAHGITSPVRIIIGSKDNLSPLTSMELLKNAIPDASITVIPNEGHIIPLENPGALGTAIRSFIESDSSPHLHT